MPEYHYSARFYDAVLSPFITPIRRRVVSLVRKQRYGRILDVCCGTGDQLKFLKRYGFEGEGVDLSDAMLAVAHSGEDPANCIHEDATQMHYGAERFDMVMTAFALHEKPHTIARKIVEEMYRVTAEDGDMLIVDYEISEKTSRFSKMMITLIERIAGGEHYQNFKSYNQRGGLPALLMDIPVTEVERHYFSQHGVVLVLFRKEER